MTLVSAQASAATVTYKLVRLTLTNVSDAAGLWQHEGGDVRNANNVKIGKYALHRRVTTGGTNEQNTAMVTLTIFYLGGSPPRNITLQGAHSYNNGRYVGGVSATSPGLTAFADGTFVGSAASSVGPARWLSPTEGGVAARPARGAPASSYLSARRGSSEWAAADS